MNSFNVQELEFEPVCLACEQARLHFERDCRATRLAALHLHISIVSHSRATSHNELLRGLLLRAPEDFFL